MYFFLSQLWVCIALPLNIWEWLSLLIPNSFYIHTFCLEYSVAISSYFKFKDLGWNAFSFSDLSHYLENLSVIRKLISFDSSFLEFIFLCCLMLKSFKKFMSFILSIVLNLGQKQFIFSLFVFFKIILEYLHQYKWVLYYNLHWLLNQYGITILLKEYITLHFCENFSR